jgi:hypothetical protein
MSPTSAEPTKTRRRAPGAPEDRRPGCENMTDEEYSGWLIGYIAGGGGRNGGAPTRPTEPLEIATLDEFAALQDETAEPLLGEPDENVLPVGGGLINYGPGGANKTTLMIDAAFHLADGRDWLGFDVPRAARVLVIENEGPRGMFSRQLARKAAAWDSQPSGLFILKEPWAAFSFRDPEHRKQLAAFIDEHQIDLIAPGPVAQIGMEGGGTPDDINRFMQYVYDVRSQTEREWAYWLTHHSNKVGDVSGAWDRVPDTLVHQTSNGHGRSQIHWRKVRWASSIHGATQKLAWAPGFSFTAEEPDEGVTDADVGSMILDYVADHPGIGWRPVREELGGNAERAATIRDELIADGRLANTGTGRSFKLWLPDDLRQAEPRL